MKRKYRRHPGRARSDDFHAAQPNTATEAVARKIHNDQIETAKHNREVNVARRQIITILAEDDVDPTVATEASMSVAAQIYKMPDEGMKKRGVLSFMRLAWRCFRKTRLVAAEEKVEVRL